MGGDLDLDTALVAWDVGSNDSRAIHDAMKVKAMSLAHLATFFDGNSTANVKEYDGLNTRLTGKQVIEAGADGASLTLDMLDDLVDAVSGTPSLLLMNKKARSRIRQLARMTGGLSIARMTLAAKSISTTVCPSALSKKTQTVRTFLASTRCRAVPATPRAFMLFASALTACSVRRPRPLASATLARCRTSRHCAPASNTIRRSCVDFH
jgi:hypothetical protein